MSAIGPKATMPKNAIRVAIEADMGCCIAHVRL